MGSICHKRCAERDGSDVQADTLFLHVRNKDVIVSAQMITGKTPSPADWNCC